MIEPDHAATMLQMAEMDLNTIRLMLEHGGFDEEAFGFHAQQATEKALKALIVSMGLICPRTHDLTSLAELIQKNGCDIPESFDELTDLTSFAVEFRYQPLSVDEPSLDRAALADRIAQLIVYVKQALTSQSSDQP